MLFPPYVLFYGIRRDDRRLSFNLEHVNDGVQPPLKRTKTSIREGEDIDARSRSYVTNFTSIKRRIHVS